MADNLRATPHDELMPDAVVKAVEKAREQGYREAFIELTRKYNPKDAISDEKYKRYLDAKLKHERTRSRESMKHLIEVTLDVM